LLPSLLSSLLISNVSWGGRLASPPSLPPASSPLSATRPSIGCLGRACGQQQHLARGGRGHFRRWSGSLRDHHPLRPDHSLLLRSTTQATALHLCFRYTVAEWGTVG
ncbi:hypothetical protein PMAYCL1PPCAC_25140, partial [Pristionchus mayeri]